MKYLFLFVIISIIACSSPKEPMIDSVQAPQEYSFRNEYPDSNPEIKPFPTEFVAYDTLNFGDDRFHDDSLLERQIFGITESGDTLSLKFESRKRWN